MSYRDPVKNRAYQKAWAAEHQDSVKRWAKEAYNPPLARIRRKKWIDKNRNKHLAHQAVRNALARGKIRKLPCEVCGDQSSHAHHDDYSKRLEVRWLCALHHKAHHKRTMNIDHWKSTNPQDEELGSQPQPGQDDEPIEEPGRLNKGMCYNPSNLRVRGWWTPVGYRHSMPGYDPMEYFEGPFSGPARYLGPDSFGVEPLFESL